MKPKTFLALAWTIGLAVGFTYEPVSPVINVTTVLSAKERSLVQDYAASMNGSTLTPFLKQFGFPILDVPLLLKFWLYRDPLALAIFYDWVTIGIPANASLPIQVDIEEINSYWATTDVDELLAPSPIVLFNVDGTNVKPTGWKTTGSVCVPVVFHIYQYREGASFGPVGSDLDQNYIRAVDVMNRDYGRLTNGQLRFCVTEIRKASDGRGYLEVPDQQAWLDLPSQQRLCQRDSNDPPITVDQSFISKTATENNVPGVVNVYVGGQSGTNCGMGPIWAEQGEEHIFMTWDTMSLDILNNDANYNLGPDILTHEFGHYFSLFHTHGDGTCPGDDEIQDTPLELELRATHGAVQLTAYCRNTSPSNDHPFNSCTGTCPVNGPCPGGQQQSPSQEGPDNIYNFMAYTGAGCSQILTPEQIGRMDQYFSNEPNLSQLLANSRIQDCSQCLNPPPNPCLDACLECRFGFQGRACVPTFNLAGTVDNMAFTPRLVYRFGGGLEPVLGIVNSNNLEPEVLLHGGTFTDVTSVTLPGQSFTPTIFKPFAKPPDYKFSGIGHETFQGSAQENFAKGKCWRVFFSEWQALPNPVVGNQMTENFRSDIKGTNCAVFRTA